MEEAIRLHLLAQSGVSALAASRLDWGLRPAALPGGRMQVVSRVPTDTYGGRANLTAYRIQIECFGRSYAEAKRLARAIDPAVMAAPKPVFDSIFLSNERDDDDTDAAGQPVFRTLLEYRLFYQTT